MKNKHYVGLLSGKGLIYFASTKEVNRVSHGELYSAVVGPFRTKRAALWAEKYGYRNPHFQHVSDAEKLSRKDI